MRAVFDGRLTRRSRWLWLLGLVAVVSGCRADVEVFVTVDEDGSGVVDTVTILDQEAADALLDLERDSDGLPLTDLAQAGWVIGPPERSAEGSTRITASKEFGTPSQFAEVMDELTGPDGPLGDFELRRTKSFARVDYELTGTIVTTDGFSSFADDELVSALGQPLNAIAERYEAESSDIALELTVSLPGEAEGELPDGLIDARANPVTAAWAIPFGKAESTNIAFSSATRQALPLVLRGVAIVAGVLAALVVFARLQRILLPDRRRRSSKRQKSTRSSGKATARSTANEVKEIEAMAGPVAEAPPDEEANLGPTVVALDGMGVLYREAEDVAALLVPFVREMGSEASDSEIVAKARSLSLGRITTGEFWRSVGFEDNHAQLDADYLARHQLTPGVIKYLRSLRDRGVRVACLTNDATNWATQLRSRHSLDGLIDPWVISGSVGVRKPDKPIFEVLRRTTGEPAGKILVIDDDLDILDAARQLGFVTAWFSASGDAAVARGHTIIRSFDLGEDDTGEIEAVRL